MTVMLALSLGTIVASLFGFHAQQQAVEKGKALNQARHDAQRARESETLAVETLSLANQQRDRAEAEAYSSLIARALRAYQDNDLSSARKYLKACQWNLRGWEYNYIQTLVNDRRVMFRGHTHRITAMALSRDGTLLATASDDHTLRIWTNATGAEAAPPTKLNAPLACISFSPDGSYLVGGSLDHSITIWEVLSRRVVTVLEGHTAPVFAVAFTPDGKSVLSASTPTLEMPQLLPSGPKSEPSPPTSSGLLPPRIELPGETMAQSVPPLLPNPPAPPSVGPTPLDINIPIPNLPLPRQQLTADGSRATYGDIRVWDIATSETLSSITADAGTLTRAAFSPDGVYVAYSIDPGPRDSLSFDRFSLYEIQLADIVSGGTPRVLAEHSDAIQALVYSSDAKQLLSASTSKVSIWDSNTGDLVSMFDCGSSSISSAALTRSSHQFLCGHEDGTVTIIDARTGRRYFSLKDDTSPITHLITTEDDLSIVGGLDNGNVFRTHIALPNSHRDLRCSVLATLASAEEQFLCLNPEQGLSFRFLSSNSLQDVFLRSEVDLDIQIRNANGPLVKASTGIARFLGYHLGRRLHPRQAIDSYDNMHVAFSPDGQRMARVVHDRIEVYDISARQKLFDLKHSDSVVRASFLSDGPVIVSVSMDDTLRYWNADTGNEVSRIQLTAVVGAAFNPNATRVAIARLAYPDKSSKAEDNNGEEPFAVASGASVDVWDLTKRQLIFTTSTQHHSISSISYSPDSRRLVTAGEDSTIRVWDAATGAETLTLDTGKEFACCVAFSPDMSRIAGISKLGTLRLWNANNGHQTLAIEGLAEDVASIGFSPDGMRIAIFNGPFPTSINLFSAVVSSAGRYTRGHDGAVRSVRFTPDDTRMVSSAALESGGFELFRPARRMNVSGEIKIWDRVGGYETLRIKGGALGGGVIGISRDGEHLISTRPLSKLLSLYLYDQLTEETKSFRSEWAQGVGLEDGLTKWNLKTGKQIGAINSHQDIIADVCFNPDHQQLAIASGSMVSVWNVSDGSCHKAMTGHRGIVTSVAYQPGGTRIASVSMDVEYGEIKVWNAETGREVLSLEIPDGLTSIAYSPDGKQIVCGGSNGSLAVFNSADIEMTWIVHAHAKSISKVLWSSDGAWVISGSVDQSVKVWDAAGGEERIALTEHLSPVSDVAMSSDCETIACGYEDGAVVSWDFRQLLKNHRKVSELASADQVKVVHLARLNPLSMVKHGIDELSLALWLLRQFE